MSWFFLVLQFQRNPFYFSLIYLVAARHSVFFLAVLTSPPTVNNCPPVTCSFSLDHSALTVEDEGAFNALNGCFSKSL